MNEQNKIFIHIGLPKTGTTTLQNDFFSKLENFDFHGMPKRKSWFEKYSNLIRESEEIEFDYENIKKKIYENISKKTIISDEGFSTFGCSYTERALIAQRLKKIFPNAKIIITLREQRKLIESFIRWTYFQNSTLKKDNYSILYFMSELKKRGIENLSYREKLQVYYTSYIKLLNYYDLVKYYSNLFGKENVLVLLFEEFTKNKKVFSNKLADFMNLDKNYSFSLLSNVSKHNSAMSEKEYKFRKIFKNIFPNLTPNDIKKKLPKKISKKIEFFIKKGNKKEIIIEKDILEEIEQISKKSNIKLSREFNIDLKKYGYFF